jgi:hypothetical protein
MVYYTPAGDKKYHVKTIEAFQDISNILKDVLPLHEPIKDIYILVEQTMETYKWNYKTRTFDLLNNKVYTNYQVY